MPDESFIQVSVNTRNFLRQADLSEGKVRRLSANALTETAKGIRFRYLPKGMDKHIEGGPTKFTRVGGRWMKANSKTSKQVAHVYVAPIQESYLKTIIKGGVRRDNLPVPGSRAKLTKHGNLPLTATKGKTAFRIVSRGLPMHVRRVGRKGAKKIHMIAAWFKYRFYKKTFPYFSIVEDGARKSYNREYKRAFKKVFK